MSTHQPQPLIWLARSPISSWVDFGSGEFAITMLALANRLANFAPSSLPNMLKRGSMVSSSLVVWAERTGDAGNLVFVTASPGCHKTVRGGVWWGTSLRVRRSSAMADGRPDPATEAF